MRTLISSVQQILPLLKVASVERIALLHWLKEASAADDIIARYSILEGALGVPQWSITGRGARPDTMSDAVLNNPKLRIPQDPVNRDTFYSWLGGGDLRFREALLRGAEQINLEGKSGYSAEDLAQALSSGIYFSGRIGKSLYYYFGEVFSRQILGGNLHAMRAQRMLGAFAKRRALDVLKLKKRQEQGAAGLDTQIGDEGGRTLAEMISTERDVDLVEAAFDTNEGHEILRDFDRYLTPAFSDAPQQLALWEAVRDNPAIIGSQSQMAAAYAERTGNQVSGPATYNLWKKILKKIQETVAAHPELVERLEDVRDVKQMFRMASELRAKEEGDPCWEGYEMYGMKEGEKGKPVPNCIPQKKASFDVDLMNLAVKVLPTGRNLENIDVDYKDFEDMTLTTSFFYMPKGGGRHRDYPPEWDEVEQEVQYEASLPSKVVLENDAYLPASILSSVSDKEGFFLEALSRALYRLGGQGAYDLLLKKHEDGFLEGSSVKFKKVVFSRITLGEPKLLGSVKKSGSDFTVKFYLPMTLVYDMRRSVYDYDGDPESLAPEPDFDPDY